MNAFNPMNAFKLVPNQSRKFNNMTLAYWLLAVALTIGQTAFATPAIQNAFSEAYPFTANSQLNSCTTCHLPAIKGSLNSYGAALAAEHMVFQKIEASDSDGDGKSNLDEIKALVFPGSHSEVPEVFVFTNKLQPVTFRHGEHSMGAKYLVNGNCTACHNSQDANHFDKNFDNNVLIKDKAHNTCIGCHKNSGLATAPTKCNDCHKKP